MTEEELDRANRINHKIVTYRSQIKQIEDALNGVIPSYAYGEVMTHPNNWVGRGRLNLLFRFRGLLNKGKPKDIAVVDLPNDPKQIEIRLDEEFAAYILDYLRKKLDALEWEFMAIGRE